MTNERIAMIVLALTVVCATVLTALGNLDPQAFVALVGGLVGGLAQRYLTRPPSSSGSSSSSTTPPPPPVGVAGGAVGPAVGMLLGGLGAGLLPLVGG